MPAPADFHCPQCGYDLRGQIVQRCPECGFGYDARSLQRIYRVAFRNARDGYLELATFLAAMLPLILGGLAVCATRRFVSIYPSIVNMLPMLWLPAIVRGWVLRGRDGIIEEILPDSWYEFVRPVGTSMDVIVYACFFALLLAPWPGVFSVILLAVLGGTVYSIATNGGSEGLEVLKKLSAEGGDVSHIIRRARMAIVALAILHALGWVWVLIAAG